MYKMLVGSFAALFLLACGETEPVRIAVFGSTTGPTADLGIGGRNGVILASEEFNEAGGAKGRLIELTYFDPQGSAELGTQLIKEVIATEPAFDVVVGPMISSMAVNIKPLTDDAELLLVGITTSSTALSGQDDYFIRAIADTAVHAKGQGRYIASEMGVESVCLITDQANAAYTNSWAEQFIVGLGSAVDSRCHLQYHSGPDVDFQEIIAEVVGNDPQMLVLVSNAADASKFIKFARQQAPSLLISTAAWAGTQRLIEFGGKDVDGVFVTQTIDRFSDDPDYVAFAEKFRQRFGGLEPGFPGMQAYNATTAVIEGLRTQEKNQSLKDAILSVEQVKFLQETVSFDQFGDVNSAQYMTRIEDGVFVTLDALKD
jgi:branched-chain amino acid transport system substrate-binding protein